MWQKFLSQPPPNYGYLYLTISRFNQSMTLCQEERKIPFQVTKRGEKPIWQKFLSQPPPNYGHLNLIIFRFNESMTVSQDNDKRYAGPPRTLHSTVNLPRTGVLNPKMDPGVTRQNSRCWGSNPQMKVLSVQYTHFPTKFLQRARSTLAPVLEEIHCKVSTRSFKLRSLKCKLLKGNLILRN